MANSQNADTTVLTDEQIAQTLNDAGVTEYADVPLRYDLEIARAIEQAVLQSPEVQALRKDAQRYRWLKANIQDDYALPGGYYIPDEDTETWDKTVDAAMEKRP